MRLVYIFTACLVGGMVIGQVFDLSHYISSITFLADICLSFIMMEVGLEFVLYKNRWKSYIKDYFVASLAAALPWLFCFTYFYFWTS